MPLPSSVFFAQVTTQNEKTSLVKYIVKFEFPHENNTVEHNFT